MLIKETREGVDLNIVVIIDEEVIDDCAMLHAFMLIELGLAETGLL